MAAAAILKNRKIAISPRGLPDRQSYEILKSRLSAVAILKEIEIRPVLHIIIIIHFLFYLIKPQIL